MIYKILIVEDEEVTAIALSALLESFGYEITDCVNSAEDAFESIGLNPPDIIISDIMIKGSISGGELAKQIYLKYKIPIIFLTAYCDNEMIQYALDANAYGYIMKPYKENEIKATISLTINKLQNNRVTDTRIKFEEYNFDLRTKKLFNGNEEVKLGKKSLKLLSILISNKNNMTTFETLIHELWNYEDEKSIDKLRQLVKRTKEKLNISCIESVKNIGYKISVD